MWSRSVAPVCAAGLLAVACSAFDAASNDAADAGPSVEPADDGGGDASMGDPPAEPCDKQPIVHEQRFDTPAMPPQPWTDGSRGGGTVAHAAEGLLGPGSLLATAPIDKTVARIVHRTDVAVASVDLRFAVRVDRVAAYAELGCAIRFERSGAASRVLLVTHPNGAMTTKVVLEGAAMAPEEAIFEDFESGWYRVRMLARVGANGRSAPAVTVEGPGGAVATAAHDELEVGDVTHVQVSCGIDYASPPGSMTPPDVVTVNVDDITYAICPR